MKTSRLSTVPTSSSSTSSTSSSSPSNSGSTNTVGSRLFTPNKVDTSPLDFENEKELQKKLDDIVSEFKNKDKEWTFRLKALQVLQRIINGNGIEFKGWSLMLRSISPALIEQLTELRSTIVKEACASVSLLGFRMKSKFEPFALQYTQALIRMVPVKTTIISESAHQTLKDILESVATKSLLQTFLDASLDQHNEQLRKRASEYIYIVLSRAIENDGMILISSVPALEKSIQKLLVDGASETRQMARYCFWAYAELNEKSATTLFYTHFTPTTQKNLFTVQEHLKGDQLEFCEKLKNSLFEEEQHQKMVEDSNDLDFDLNDFKKDPQPSTTTTTTTTNNDNSIRSKTPTTGRATSGLKMRSTATSTTTSTTTTPSKSSSSINLRSGSSIGNRIDGSSSVGGSIKRPLDASNIIRSKSSLGTTRKDVIAGGSSIGGSSGGGGGGGGSSSSMQSPVSKTPTTMITKTASSSSPNLATSTQSGRYSSIGTRAITTSLSKQSSSSNLTRSLPPINKSPISPPGPTPPAPTLTKSKSTPSSPLSTPSPSKLTSSTNITSTPTRRISSSTTSSPIGTTTTSALKKPSTLTSTPKSSSSSSIKTPSTSSTTSTTTSSATKKSFITKTENENENIKTTSTTPKSITKTTTSSSSSSSSIKGRSDNVDEIDLESLEISLNQDNKLAFNEISDEISNNLRDAKKGLSFYEKELTLDDLENNSNSNSNSNNNSKRSSVSSFTNSIKESTTADVDFNWLEDSVHDSLIDDDVLDFNENNNSTYIPRNNKTIKEDGEEQQQQEVLNEDDDDLMF
ncbi:hypothetical protein ACTA71_009124 [Dictyostelium dimigraforme]